MSMSKPVKSILRDLRICLRERQFDKMNSLFQQMFDLYRTQQSRMEALLDTVNEAVCMIDETNQVVVWNHRAELLYGISSSKILHQPIHRFFSNVMICKVMQTHSLVTEQYHAPCPDKHVLINASPIRQEGRITGAVSTERDITDLVELNQQLSQTHREMQSLKKTLNEMHSQNDPFFSIHGRGKAIREAVRISERVAPTSVPILLRGESGTGKDLFARAIHEASHATGHYVAINCGAIPANLFESELFGYQSGAFTGAARKGKEGLLEKAKGGTVLLDEVGDLPREMQVKLLRTLQEKQLYRVGSNEPIAVDFRVIAATNRNLEKMIGDGDFREDLYYRLNVVTISLPPLRERQDDIPELFHRGLQYYCALHNKNITQINSSLMVVLVQYQWPGNIREFLNVLERLVILAEGDALGIENLPKELFAKEQIKLEQDVRKSNSLPEVTAGLERDMIAKVLVEEGNNKALTAKKLGLSRSTLYYKMQKFGIECRKTDE